MSSDYIMRDFVAPVNLAPVFLAPVYVSDMTLYDFQEVFFDFDRKWNLGSFLVLIFLYDPCMNFRKTKNDAWMNTKSSYKSYMT